MIMNWIVGASLLLGGLFSVSLVFAFLMRGRSTQPAVKNEVNLEPIFKRLQLYSEESVATNSYDHIRGKVVKSRDVIHKYPSILFNPDHVYLTLPDGVRLSQVQQCLKGLGQELFKAGRIPSQYLQSQATGYPNRVRLNYCSELESRLSAVCYEAGLSNKTQAGDVILPSIVVTDSALIVIPGEVILSKAALEKAIPYFNAVLGGGSFEFDSQKISLEDGRYSVSKKVRLEPFLGSGQILLQKFDTWIEQYIAPNKSNPDQWYLGQEKSSGKDYWLPTISYPALLISGGMGSGKTTTVKSILASRLALGKVQMYFFDGKASQDWASMAQRTSKFPLLVPREERVNPLVEFDNLINRIWNEYKRRQALLQTSQSSNFLEHNSKSGTEKLTSVVTLLEEAGVIFNFLDFNSTHDIIGSSANKLKRLLKESRSFGFNYVLVNQEVTAASVPPVLAKNMTYLIHRSNQQTASYFKCEEIVSLDKGEFIYISEGNQYTLRNFYLGSDTQIEETLNLIGVPASLEKESINYNLVGYTGAEKTNNQFHALSKISLLRGCEITEWKDDSISDVAAVVKAGNSSVAISYLGKDEVSARHIQSIYAKTDFHLFILDQTLTEAAEDKLIDRARSGDFAPTNPIFISQQRFLKLIEQSFKDEELTPVLNLIQKASNEAVERAEEERKADVKAEEATTESLESVKLTVKELHRIKELKVKTDASAKKKGDALELFLAALYKAQGYAVTLGRKNLVKAGFIEDYSDRGGDCGLDLVAEKEGEVLAIQAKAYTGQVSVNAVEQVVRACAYVKSKKGIEAKPLVIATSILSDPATDYARMAGVKVVEMPALVKMVADLEASAPKSKGGRPKKDGGHS